MTVVRRVAIMLVIVFGMFVLPHPTASRANELLSFGPQDTPALVTVSAGSIGNVIGERDEAMAFTLEYRAGSRWEFLYIRPSVGVMVTTDRSLYGWFGLSTDVFLWRRVVLTPETGIGFYFEGDGQDLGSVLEFRSGGNLAWRFDSEARLGVRFHHISNLGIGDTNPGTESVAIFYSHPF